MLIVHKELEYTRDSKWFWFLFKARLDFNKVHAKSIAFKPKRSSQLLWTYCIYHTTEGICGSALRKGAWAVNYLQLHLLQWGLNHDKLMHNQRLGLHPPRPQPWRHYCHWCRRVTHWWWLLLINNPVAQVWWVDKLQSDTAGQVDATEGSCDIWWGCRRGPEEPPVTKQLSLIKTVSYQKWAIIN